jgi:hypothetical protein
LLISNKVCGAFTKTITTAVEYFVSEHFILFYKIHVCNQYVLKLIIHTLFAH